MKYLSTIFCLLIIANLTAQTWEKTYAADSLGNGLGFGQDLIQTSDNGYLIGGEVDLPTGAIRHYIQLKKTDENGNLLWRKIYGYGDIRNDKLAAVDELPNGDLLIGGSTFSPTNGVLIMRTNAIGDTIWRKVIPTANATINTNFDKISNGQFLSFSRSNTDVRLIKIDTNGTALLNKVLADYFIPKAAAELSNGDFILTGEKNGHLYLMKTNQLGDSIWTKQLQFGTGDFGSAVYALPNNEFLIGGSTSGFAGLNPVMFKFDGNGMVIWNTMIQVLSSTAQVSDIIVDDFGKIYVTGSFDAENFYTFEGGFISRFDANGTNQVTDTLNTFLKTDGAALIFSNDGCLVTTGGNINGYYLRKQCNLTTTSKADNFYNTKVAVYPNPMVNEINFNIESEKYNSFSLIIYDISGQVILQKTINKQYLYQNKNLPKGSYIYSLLVDNQLIKSGIFIKK